jgi:hypothetical protein
MENHDNSPNKRQGQDNYNRTQKKTIFHYLLNHTATASMVTDATGIPQKCITRYKRDLEKQGLLAEVKKDYCELTGHLAWYLTTDQSQFPMSNQLTIF